MKLTSEMKPNLGVLYVGGLLTMDSAEAIGGDSILDYHAALRCRSDGVVFYGFAAALTRRITHFLCYAVVGCANP